MFTIFKKYQELFHAFDSIGRLFILRAIKMMFFYVIKFLIFYLGAKLTLT